MGRVYEGQSSLRIQLTCSQDITDAITKLIYYEKPSGTQGYWTATVGTVATGVIYYDVSLVTEIDQTGWWKFWSYIEFSDSRIAYGEVARYLISEVGIK